MFVTLTYRDEEMPEPPDVSKDELQRFFKRLRRRIEPRRLRYYACGEYGEKYGRPHYHAAIFGLAPCGACPSCCRGSRGGAPVVGSQQSPVQGRLRRSPREKTDCEILQECWSFGFIHVDDVTPASTRYIAGYIEKALFTKALAGRARPFSVMSKGLGRRYALDHYERLLLNGGETIGGRKIKLPKYYEDLLGVPTANKVRWSEDRRQEVYDHYVDGSGEYVNGRVFAHRIQTEKNLAARDGLRERDYEL